MVAFFLVALIMLPFLMVGMIGAAFLRLGISPSLIFWLLILTLLGSLVNIPIYRFENRELVGEQVVSYFGMRYRVPRLERGQATILAVNVGGALIPVALSGYFISQINFGVSVPCSTASARIPGYDSTMRPRPTRSVQSWRTTYCATCGRYSCR